MSNSTVLSSPSSSRISDGQGQQTRIQSSSATAISGQSTSQTPATNHGSSSESLSSGAKAGIAIGTIFGFTILCFLAFLILKRRKSKKNAASNRVEYSDIDLVAMDKDRIGRIRPYQKPQMVEAELEAKNPSDLTRQLAAELPQQETTPQLQRQVEHIAVPILFEPDSSPMHEMDATRSIQEIDSSSLVVPTEAQVASGPIHVSSAHSADEGDGVSATHIIRDEQSLGSSTLEGTLIDPDPGLATSRMREIEEAKLQLQERRKRLLALQQMDEEEERLNQELESLKAEQRERQGGS